MEISLGFVLINRCLISIESVLKKVEKAANFQKNSIKDCFYLIYRENKLTMILYLFKKILPLHPYFR